MQRLEKLEQLVKDLGGEAAIRNANNPSKSPVEMTQQLSLDDTNQQGHVRSGIFSRIYDEVRLRGQLRRDKNADSNSLTSYGLKPEHCTKKTQIAPTRIPKMHFEMPILLLLKSHRRGTLFF